MFKKVFIIIAAIITMMMACAGPIMTRVHAADDFPLSLADLKIKNESPGLVDNSHYVFCNTNLSDLDDSKTGAIVVRIIDTFLDNVYCEFSNNIFILRSKDFSNAFDIFVFYDYGGFHSYNRSAAAIQFDFNDNSVYALDADSNYIRIWGYDSSVTLCQFDNFETNFDEYSPVELDLDVSFKPVLSGEISRSQNIDGKEYTSKTLDMIIKNNGSNAQFAMFIVNKGENITFPESSLQNNQGFEGNPVYCYVSDEWSSFTVGLLGSAVYAPCAWHTIAAGYNQTYSIYWEQISLEANHEYDVVVYGCVNDQAIQTNTSTQWEMRPVYTVTSSLDDVKEVYRSTFTISDPAEFNPNFIDEGGSVHPWNPNSDNSGLFNASSAYRDDNGNIVIKGQTSNGGFNVFSDFSGISVQNMNVNNVFGDTFKFFTSILGFFPPVWIALITVGLSAIVTIAIIKKVT